MRIQAVLTVLFVVLFVFAWKKCHEALFRKMSGWKTIATRFSSPNTLIAGEAYKKRDGVIGDDVYRQRFNIHLTSEGVYVCAFFARQAPILVPWSSIRSVSDCNLILLLTVDYDKTMQFYLPSAASAFVKEKVPVERWQKGDVIVGSAKASFLGDNQQLT